MLALCFSPLGDQRTCRHVELVEEQGPQCGESHSATLQTLYRSATEAQDRALRRSLEFRILVWLPPAGVDESRARLPRLAGVEQHLSDVCFSALRLRSGVQLF
jgi:hypothetical protein